jgi:hypothetical protein
MKARGLHSRSNRSPCGESTAVDLDRERRIKWLARTLERASPDIRRPIWQLLRHEILSRSDRQVAMMELAKGLL